MVQHKTLKHSYQQSAMKNVLLSLMHATPKHFKLWLLEALSASTLLVLGLCMEHPSCLCGHNTFNISV